MCAAEENHVPKDNIRKGAFRTAPTAFPKPQPGKAHPRGPMKVPAEQLNSLLGVADVNFARRKQALGLVDSTLD